jgi:hypothetical protein
MKFKEWLINEDGFGGGSGGGSSWDLLYPTIAGDYASAVSEPLEHYFLQWKWDRGTDPDIGRVLHNIKNDDFQRVDYSSVESTTMPDAGEGFWKHKEDDGSKSSTKPYRLPELKWLCMGETSKDTKYVDMENAGKIKIWSGAGGPTSIHDDTDLDQIFHDEDRHSHKWPTINPEYMDSEWTKKFEAYVAEYGLASGGAAGLPWSGHSSDGETNRTMNVASKWTSKDGKNNSVDQEVMPDPDIAFGYKGRPKDKKKRLKDINRNRNIKPKRIDVSDIIY